MYYLCLDSRNCRRLPQVFFTLDFRKSSKLSSIVSIMIHDNHSEMPSTYENMFPSAAISHQTVL